MLQGLGFGSGRQLPPPQMQASHPPLPVLQRRSIPLSSRQHNLTMARTLFSCPAAATASAAAAAATAHQPVAPTRYAIIGAGLAGVAMAWHLIDKTRRARAQGGGHGRPIEVLVFDAAGILAGGSGSAAGLLHAFTPRGKPIWQGEEGMRATLELVQVAARHAAASAQRAGADGGSGSEGVRRQADAGGSGGELRPAQHGPQPARREALASSPGEDSLPGLSFPPASSSFPSPSSSFLWYHGLVRPAASAKQAVHFYRSCHPTQAGPEPAARPASESAASGAGDTGGRPTTESSALSGRCITPAELQQLLPGLKLLPWVTELQDQQRQAGECLAGLGNQQAEVRAWERAEDGAGDGAAKGEEEAEGEETAGPSGPELAASCAFHIPGGLVLDVQQYLPGLWGACQAAAVGLGDGSQARLVVGSVVRSLELLEQEQGPFAAVVVAAGAAAETIAEVVEVNPPLKICQGYSLFLSPGQAVAGPEQQQQQQQQESGSGQEQLAPEQDHPGGAQEQGQGQGPHTLSYPEGAPSILGQVYMAAHGSQRLVVGATRSYGWTAQEALEMCQAQHRGEGAAGQACAAGTPGSVAAELPSRAAASGVGPLVVTSGAGDVASGASTSPPSSSSNSSGSKPSTKSKYKGKGRLHPKNSVAAAEAAKEELLAAVGAHWPPVLGWQVDEIRTGMRGLPPRTAAGAVPLVGRLREGRPWWLVAGLGARGLVYHAWLAEVVAAAVLADDEGLVQPEALLTWRSAGAGGRPVVFDQP